MSCGQIVAIAHAHRSLINFVRYIELRALLGQLLLKHLANIRFLVTALDGAAALFCVEIQTAPIGD
jgi:hypothetical protein